MSNAIAIAAVTATLRNMVESAVTAGASLLPIDPGQIDVTVRTPERPTEANSRPRLNLYLFHILHNAAWRNEDALNVSKPGERGFPALALDLFYMLSAFGPEPDMDLVAQRLLGLGMGALHSQPLLSSAAIKSALPTSDLDRQVERVRITPHQLSLDELSKLWTGLSIPSQLCAAYHVSVVLIDSNRPVRAALPVLKRGSDGTGATVVPDPTRPAPTLPTLLNVLPPAHQSSVRLGETLGLAGLNLAGDSIAISFQTSLRNTPLPSLVPVTANASHITVALPAPGNAADAGAPTAQWPVGIYSVEVAVTTAGKTVTSQRLPLSLAPRITTDLSGGAVRNGDGSLDLELDCVPLIWPEQRVSLIIGDREVRAQALGPTKTGHLVFAIPELLPGNYYLRLRVDGIDSILVDQSGDEPVFDPLQRVEVT